MPFFKIQKFFAITGLALSVISCASIPEEAPLLSQKLGEEIQKLETSHFQILEAYFDLKREKARDYLQKVWLPKYAENFFSKPSIKEMWEIVSTTGTEKDRLKFLLVTAPELQSDIDQQYQAMIDPLDQLEKQLKSALSENYNNARSINNTLTSFLYSASEVQKNRQRYLDMAGITEEKISSAINNMELATANMLSTATKTDTSFSDVEGSIQAYKDKINQILNQF